MHFHLRIPLFREYCRNKKLITFVLLLAFLLTACGGGNSTSPTINVELTEFHFTPDTFTIPAGKEITFNGTSNGAVIHEFVIMKLGTAVGDDFGPEDAPNIYWKISVEPGEKKAATFTAPTEPGEYQVVCGTNGHYVAGMIGTLKVVAGN